jgi:hypothetical protein
MDNVYNCDNYTPPSQTLLQIKVNEVWIFHGDKNSRFASSTEYRLEDSVKATTHALFFCTICRP